MTIVKAKGATEVSRRAFGEAGRVSVKKLGGPQIELGGPAGTPQAGEGAEKEIKDKKESIPSMW